MRIRKKIRAAETETPPDKGAAGDKPPAAVTLADALAKEAEITARLAVMDARLEVVKKRGSAQHDT